MKQWIIRTLVKAWMPNYRLIHDIPVDFDAIKRSLPEGYHISRNPVRKKGEPCIVVPYYEKESTLEDARDMEIEITKARTGEHDF
jgi:hypothetical protein